MDTIQKVRADKPTKQEVDETITLIFDMAAKQANPKVKASYIQVASWLRDQSEGGAFRKMPHE